MTSRAFKLRFRRRLRLQRAQVENLGQQAELGLERNFFRRLDRLGVVRRFATTWLLLMFLLGGCVIAQISALGAYYKSPHPVAGGRYSEGIVGSFTNANPLYASGPVDSSVSHLLFASLFTYDQHNNLRGDLAESITADERGTVYTVVLKPKLMWHDGKPLTAADVAFTYMVIQNPDAQSPFRPSWQGIAVKAVDDRTVTFTLPSQLSSFPHSLTNGIVPKHVLEGQSMASLRTSPFNTSQPVGAGPFKLSAVQVSGGTADQREEQVAMVPFEHYNGGRPKIDRFIVHSYRNEQQLLASFKRQDIDAMVGLTKIPEQYVDDGSTQLYSFPMTAAVMSFFRTSEGVLSDVYVRRALVRATNNPAIIKNLQYPAVPVREPILQGQVGYDINYTQPGFDLPAAKKILDEQGWLVGRDGIREKAGQKLSFSLYAQNNSEYANVASDLQKQWRALGADVQVSLKNGADFQQILSSSTRSYDALLYGISIGKDPDVYVYWDSKNADVRSESRLNFSEYKSATADAALQAGRTRSDATLRAIKYQPFLQAWRDDAPAVGLYQPRFLYVTHPKVYGLDEHVLNNEVERFTNVQNWMVRESPIAQTK
jgi:peptide/nickel transport system substrate-binding protein